MSTPYKRMLKTGSVRVKPKSLSVPQKKVVKKMIKRQIARNVPDKNAQTSLTSFVLSPTATFLDLTQISTAVGLENRDSGGGDTIHVKRITMRGMVSDGSVPDSFRIVIFKWRPERASDAPTHGEICGFAGLPAVSPFGQFNIENPGRYRVLADRLYNTDPTDSRTFMINLKKLDITTHYNNGDVLGLTGIDHIYLAIWCGATSTSAITFVVQLVFEDS